MRRVKVAYRTKDQILDTPSRKIIYDAILNSSEPRHFRELCRLVNKQSGSVQYHLGVLEKTGLIRSKMNGRYKCFFTTIVDKTLENLSIEERNFRESVKMFLKKKSAKKIIDNLYIKNDLRHQELAIITNITPQAITYHMKSMEKNAIVKSEKRGRQKVYHLTQNTINVIESI